MSFENQGFAPLEIGQLAVSSNSSELNEHNMYLFDQQTPHVSRLDGMPSDMLKEMSYNTTPPHANVPDSQFDGLYNNASLWSENASFAQGMPLQSMSSVSSPLNGVAKASAPPPQKSPVETVRNRRARDKQLLSDEESRLMDLPDLQLSEKELAMKKKAVNRLAQRAFRERKENKFKQLKDQLTESEDERQKLRDELDRIQMRYASLRSENQILRKGTDTGSGSGSQKFSFPSTQAQFILTMLQDNPHHVVRPESVNHVYNAPSDPAVKLLAIGAVWDYLQLKQEESEYESLDMMEVMRLLRGNEKCHGFGPAYSLDLVNQVLAEVAASQKPV